MVRSSWLEAETGFVNFPAVAITFGSLVKELGDFPSLDYMGFGSVANIL